MIHEMKNSLAAITIQSELVKDQLPKAVLDDFAVMTQEVKRLSNLANNMSDFIKNPVGNPKDIELVSFISGLTKLFKKKVSLNTGNCGEVHVLFDPDRARSVFENLIKNACESTESRDPQVEVEIKSDFDNVYVFIMDRGDGIKEEDKERLFDPCFTTKTHGSGVGLSVSKQFVQAQGGDLILYPREGGGVVAEVRMHKEK